MKRQKNSSTDRIGVSIVDEKFSRCGYIFREQPIVDCGIDAHIELVDEDSATGNLIALQIKSGPSWFTEETDNHFIFRGDNNHLSYWLDHSLPVVIILCNVDTRECFWQSISPTYIIKTPKAWKIGIPKSQKINAGMNTDLKRLVNKLPAPNDFTIVSTGDVSHGRAKRYSLRIVLNKEHTQAEIIDLIKIQTKEAIYCEYHRSDIVRKHWRNKPAQVVWLFIYPSAEDEKKDNFICQSEWVSNELPKDFSPISNKGEKISNNLLVIWNDSYLETATFHSSNSMSKEEFVLLANKSIETLTPLISEAQSMLSRYKKEELSFLELKLILTELFDKVDNVNSEVNDSNFAPYECNDADLKLKSVVCFAHNVFLPFSGIGNWDNDKQIIHNIESQINYYFTTLPEFQFEIKKVQ
ncbi:MAG: DUF4365 domain-containing protein [bacterium]|nr:DUF4365 domain-containing protein [bacterium]